MNRFARIPFFLFLPLCTLLLLAACDGVSSSDPAPPASTDQIVDGLPFGDFVDPSTLPPELRTAFQEPGTWVFDESIGLTCRDGSTTGIGVRLQEDDVPSRRGGPFNRDNYSDNLVIFLEGGGACFNNPTCAQNRANFRREEFFSEDFVGGYSGIFDATQPANPVADWSFVYVPYCTGDEHVGSTTDGDVPDLVLPNPAGGTITLPGPKDQQFVGYQNVGRVVDYLTRYLGTGFDNVLITGSSAGGVGALGNYTQIAAAFPEANNILLNDSGPVFYDDNLLPIPLQELWRSTWNLDPALPDGSAGQVDVLEDIYADVVTQVPDGTFGFISYEQDFTIRFFYSFGVALQDPLCAQTLFGGLLSGQRLSCIDGTTYEDALYTLRDDLPAPYRTFYTSVPDPRLHTFLRDERFYVATAGGQNLGAWIGDLIDGTAQDRGSRPLP